ncbi:MAG: hypothetical protein ONB05_10320, partial [candidate division KSB1 bacterium]|nr:hypothetical protein [candidate division KSB1 bacterium]
RSGYQINGDDLGDFSFGVSLRYSGFATGLQSDYTRSDFGQVIGYTQKGAMSLRPVSPEPFRLFLPADESLFNLDEEITLEWEEAPDPDAYDKVVYEVILKDEKGKIISSHKTENTHITLPNPGEGTYRWSVKAIDRDGHARFGTGSAQERTLYIKSPDLVVEKVEFIPITRLTPKDDPSQGTIRVQVTNKGQAHSGPFKVAIFDYSAEDRVKIGEKEISGLQPGESQLYTLSWRTSDMGKHRIQAVADVDNMVTESKRFEDNNSTDNSFWTVPKGKLIVRDTTKIERTEFSYIELPVIPFVFFDSSLAVVSKEYYRGDVCDPILPYLKILSDTLKAHPDIIIYLTGFINSDERLSLARERAEAVKQILIDTLGVPQEQIQIVQPANPRARRIEPRKEIWDKKTMAMINEENRRVEFSVEGELKLKHQEIVFGPITLPVEPTIRVGVISDYEVESAMGCVIWQLEVKDKSAQDLKTILAFSALPGKEKIIGQIPWNGNDQEGNPVPVDEYYSCKFEIEDELGRKFETMHYPFYLTKEVTAIRGEQIIALNEFDAAKMTYPFYAKRLVTIAAALKADSTLRVRFKGHTCCLGTQAYNDSLSYERAVALKDLFLAVVRQHFPDEFDTISKQVDLPTWWPKDKRSDCARGSREPLTIAIKGCPEEVLYGNNDTPVGRTLNRRAEIILYQKPISMEVAGKR